MVRAESGVQVATAKIRSLSHFVLWVRRFGVSWPDPESRAFVASMFHSPDVGTGNDPNIRSYSSVGLHFLRGCDTNRHRTNQRCRPDNCRLDLYISAWCSFRTSGRMSANLSKRWERCMQWMRPDSRRCLNSILTNKTLFPARCIGPDSIRINRRSRLLCR